MNLTIKKTLSWMLALAVIFAVPSLAQARGKHVVHGKVTEVNQTSITVSHDVGQVATKTVINVPTGTPITDKKTGATLQLSDLVGKHVNVRESSPGIAKSIVVKGHKHAKKTQSA
jgi:hypothetical protein